MTSNIKQVIVIRKDLQMRKGKMIAQGAHASLAAILQDGKLRDNEAIREWLSGTHTKICVYCDGEPELLSLYAEVKNSDIINHALIIDAGRTEFNGVSTITCFAVGPGDAEKIDKITGQLKLL